jgi:poly(ADP-ribose) glycohydrolase ARH3
MTEDRLAESAMGSLLGCGVGDAVGELAFAHRTRDDLVLTAARLPVLRYTDDTAMTIALAEALLETGDVGEQTVGDHLARIHAAEPRRGYGPGPGKIFARVARDGIDYATAAAALYDGEGSLGNGAAMRVAPVGIAYHADLDRVYEMACRSARPTHAHPVGQDGAAVQATAVALAVAHHIAGRPLDPAAFAARLTAAARTEAIRDKMVLVEQALAEDWTATAAADAIGRSVNVAESMPFAVYAFLVSPADSLRCQDIAVLNGGDRDTLGAMAMALSGAYLGRAGLRKVLVNRLENRDALADLGRRLAARFPHEPLDLSD